MTADDEIRMALKRYLNAEEAYAAAVRPFFDDGLVLTRERLKQIDAAHARVDEARDEYHEALRRRGWAPPHQPSS